MNNEIIKSAFEKTGIKDFNKLKKWLFDNEDITVTVNEVKKALETNTTVEVFNEKRKHNFRIVGDVGSYQMDIIFFYNLKSSNSGFNSILAVIHVPNRKVYLEPLKKKSAEDVWIAIQSIFDRVDNPIKTLTSDKGKEFNNNLMKRFCESNGIVQHMSDYDKLNTALVERLNRTIRSKINVSNFNYNTNTFIDKLKDIENSINTARNDTIKAAPNNIDEEEMKLINDEDRYYNKVVRNKYYDDFKIGDKVRYKIDYEEFKKKTLKYSEEVYSIEKIEGNRVLLSNGKYYKLSDIIKAKSAETPKESVKEEQNNAKKATIKRKLKKEGID